MINKIICLFLFFSEFFLEMTGDQTIALIIFGCFCLWLLLIASMVISLFVFWALTALFQRCCNKKFALYRIEIAIDKLSSDLKGLKYQRPKQDDSIDNSLDTTKNKNKIVKPRTVDDHDE